MTLQKMQVEFARLLPRLIDYCFANGYDVTLGEAWRTPEMVEIYTKNGKGSATSVHPDRLAIDLNLFINGNLLTRTDSYQLVGEYWESLGTEEVVTAWGGRFRGRPDGNHFSCQWRGRR